MTVEKSAPSPIPATPPTSDSVIDSVSTWDMMSSRLAPSALRRPISRVRSLTTISMMFMMTMPPTSSDSPTMPTSTTAMPCVACWKMPRTESDARIPKLSGCAGFSRRATRSATRVSSFAACTRDASRGLIIRASDRRAPNSFWYAPSGMTTNSSSELPKDAPFLALTPMTRKPTPAIRICLSMGSAPLKSRSATCQPISVT